MIHTQSIVLPQVLQLEVTTKCPFNCQQCYKGKAPPVHMDIEQVRQYIQEAASLKIKLIVLNGGEPLLYPHIGEVLSELHKQGIEHNLFTSGYNLTEEFVANHMRSPFLRVFVSLNGSNKLINDLSRDGWEAAIRAIRLCQKYRIPTYISWVARSDNVADFPQLMDFAERNGISKVAVIANKKTATGVIHSPLSREQFYFLVDYIKGWPANRTSIIIEECYTELVLAVYERQSSCFAQRCGCAITANGWFMNCIHQSPQIRCGSIFEFMCQRTENKREKCRKCKYSDLCERCIAASDICHLEECN